MVTLDWDVERTDGVTLVELLVESDGECRVRIENRLDGPVWPPRQEGQPAAGWDGDEFTGRVPADGQLTVGYASPAPPADPPATVVATEPTGDGDGVGGATEPPATDVAPAVESTPAGVVRSLGDPVVPRDAVPLPDVTPADDTDHAESGGTVSGGRKTGIGGSDSEAEPPLDGPAGEPDGPIEEPDYPAGVSGEKRLVVPGPVRAWLRDVEQRLDARESGDPDGATTDSALSVAVEADRRALVRVAERAETLAARAVRAERTRRTSRDGGRRDGANDRPVAPDGGGR